MPLLKSAIMKGAVMIKAPISYMRGVEIILNQNFFFGLLNNASLANNTAFYSRSLIVLTLKIIYVSAVKISLNF